MLQKFEVLTAILMTMEILPALTSLA